MNCIKSVSCLYISYINILNLPFLLAIFSFSSFMYYDGCFSTPRQLQCFLVLFFSCQCFLFFVCRYACCYKLTPPLAAYMLTLYIVPWLLISRYNYRLLISGSFPLGCLRNSFIDIIIWMFSGGNHGNTIHFHCHPFSYSLIIVAD